MPRDTANVYDIHTYIQTYIHTHVQLASLCTLRTFGERFVILLLIVSTYAVFLFQHWMGTEEREGRRGEGWEIGLHHF